MRRLVRSSGFTLLELLTALALLSALTVSLYTSLRIAFKGRDHAAETLAPTRAAVVALDLLGADLGSALAPTGILAGEFTGQDARTDAGKEADTLVFYSCAHAPEDGETAADVRREELALVVQPNEAEGVLVRRITTNLFSPELLTPREEVLCRHVLAFNLRYFDGTLWQDTWDAATHSNALPNAVELSIEVQRAHAPAPSDTSAPAAADGYRATRVLPLACATPASVDETRLIMDMSD